MNHDEQYPEHTKLHKVKDLSQACGEFLEHLAQSGIVLARYHSHDDGCGDLPRKNLDFYPAPGCGLREGELIPEMRTKQKLLAAHFDIDLDKLEAEKIQMLGVLVGK